MSLTRHIQVSRVTLFALALAAPMIALAVSAQDSTITITTTATATGIETPVVVAPDDMSWQ